MTEIEEINDKIKESGAKPKRKISKRGKIVIISTVVVIVIIVSAMLYTTLSAPPPEKYWKPEREFTMPSVDWNVVNSSYILERTTADDDGLKGYLGNKNENNIFSVKLCIKINSYDYDPSDYDSLWIYPCLYAERIGDTQYRIKELVFHFSYGDDRNVSYVSIDWRKLGAKNLYFDVTPGKYSGPYGIYDNKLDSDWMNYSKIVGVNKDGKDIKECGFTFPMQLLFFDEYPHWTNHTITFTATLYYGKYVHGWFGSGWQDVHELSTSVKIYVVPEGSG